MLKTSLALLFIAMAGFHQVWVMDVKEKTVSSYAGNGAENLENGTLSYQALGDAPFADAVLQISPDGRRLYAGTQDLISEFLLVRDATGAGQGCGCVGSGGRGVGRDRGCRAPAGPCRTT